jgi:hypothetical protein
MAAVQRDLAGSFRRRCDRGEDGLPHAPLAPAREAIVDRFVRPIFRRTILPAASDLLNVHDPAQNPPIIVTCGAALIGRQMRRDLRPLLVAEPKQIGVHGLASRAVDQTLESTDG